jgi:uncharacterized protein YqgV (UPF0045/DUF77 family)
MSDYIVNLAIQVLPLSGNGDKYSVIDRAINCIQNSGLKYKVCPFETVVEGPYSSVMNLVTEVQKVVFEAGTDEVLINMKLHRRNNRDVFIDEKTGKYEESGEDESGRRLGY